MEAEDFTREVVPAISKLFASTDRSIRRSLLESIDTYGKSLTEVNLEIYISGLNAISAYAGCRWSLLLASFVCLISQRVYGVLHLRGVTCL